MMAAEVLENLDFIKKEIIDIKIEPEDYAEDFNDDFDYSVSQFQDPLLFDGERHVKIEEHPLEEALVQNETDYNTEGYSFDNVNESNSENLNAQGQGLRIVDIFQIQQNTSTSIAVQKEIYKCRICHKILSSDGFLKRHMHNHKKHPENKSKIAKSTPYTCKICNKSFKFEESYTRHFETHSSRQPYECDYCKGLYYSKQSLINHMETHIDKHICTRCGKSYSALSSLNRHMQQHLDMKSYTCKICGYEFTKYNSFWRHLGSHSGEITYPCHLCDKYFMQQDKLLIHIYYHEDKEEANKTSEEQLHHCRMCQASFKTKHKLFEHFKQHPDIKHFQCSICNYYFVNNYTYKKHFEKHKETDRKDAYSCSNCLTKFFDQQTLNMHKEIHEHEVSYMCNDGDVSFENNAQLFDPIQSQNNEQFHCKVRSPCEIKNNFDGIPLHKRCDISQTGNNEETLELKAIPKLKFIASGRKRNRLKYKCEYCMRSFRSQPALRYHLHIHTGEAQKKCSVCNKIFSCPSSLNRHKNFSKCTRSLNLRKNSTTKTASSSSGKIQEGTQLNGFHFLSDMSSFGTDNLDIQLKNKPKAIDSTEKGANLPSSNQLEKQHAFESNNEVYNIYNVHHKNDNSYSERHRRNMELQCMYCSKLCRTANQFKFHLKFHENITQHNCTHCEMNFATSKSLSRHISRFHAEREVYRCTFYKCKVRFYNSTSFARHMERHKERTPYICNICGMGHKEHFQLSKHELVHKRKSSRIRVVKEWKSKMSLNSSPILIETNEVSNENCEEMSNDGKTSDIQMKENKFDCNVKVDENTTNRYCNECEINFSTRGSLMRHKRRVHFSRKVKASVNKQLHRCHHCLKNFLKKCYLDKHLLSHSENERKSERKIAKSIETHSQFSIDSTKKVVTDSSITMLQDKTNVSLHSITVCANTDANMDSTLIEKENSQILLHLEDNSETFTVDNTNNPVILNEQLKKIKQEFPCTICSKSYSSKAFLNCHVNFHNNRTKFNCNACEINFSFSRSLLRHNERFHVARKPYSCSFNKCTAKFFTKEQLAKHMKRHESKLLNCAICSKSFKMQAQLLDHMLIHDGKQAHKCQYCSKEFLKRCYLNKHILSHFNKKSGNFNFLCTFCSRSFVSKQALQYHLRLHTSAEKKRCHKCDKLFSCTSALNKHLITYHSEQEERKVKVRRRIKTKHRCTECEVYFATRGSLTRHYKEIHYEGKFYRCDFAGCNSEFRNLRSLQRHLKRFGAHEHLSLFKCENQSCNQTFRSRDELLYHIQSQHKQGELQCEFCSKAFFKENSLNTHIMLKHRTKNSAKRRNVESDTENVSKKFKLHPLLDDTPNFIAIPEVSIKQEVIENNDTDIEYIDANIDNNDDAIDNTIDFSQICESQLEEEESGSTLGETAQEILRNITSNPHCLNLIQRDHALNTELQCEYCLKTFLRKDRLTRHVSCHFNKKTGDYKYPCTLCSRLFVSKQALYYHLRSHTGEGKEECYICLRTFASKQCLANHIAKKHKKCS